MVKNIVRMEHKVGEKVYHFLCDQDSPLGEIHDALAAFKAHIISIIQANEDKEKEAKEAKEAK